MVTFINMVITGVENWPPGMIPVAFERKFDEEKDDFNIGGLTADTKTYKNGHNSGRMGSPWVRIWHVP